MYLSLKSGNFVLKQPDGTFFSYLFNDTRMTIGINESAEEILTCLNGQYSYDMLINYFSKKYEESIEEVNYLLRDFIDNLKNNNVLMETVDKKERMTVRESKDYYTPEHITLELTHKCPLNCKHCFLSAGVLGKEMPLEKSIYLTKELLNKGVRIFQLTGGEPFTFVGIGKIINLLIENDASVHVTTSGYINTKKVKLCLDSLAVSKDPLIQVSIDGTERIHNNIRGRKDAYRRTIQFIKECRSRNLPTIVSTILIDQSLEEIIELTGIIKKLGVKEQRLGIITNQGRAVENRLDGYTYKKYKSILQYLKSTFDDDNFTVEEIEEECNDLKDCGAGYKTLKITPKLMVTPCAMMQMNIGNLNRESLEKVLIRSYQTFSQLEFPSSKYCKDCVQEEYCKGCISEAVIRKDTVDECKWQNSQVLTETLS
ncbi:radical SAM/SPASM domain-containing protein [Enterococcus durans]|uniref:radical SAM/SPASM domain-containing protein n=1 Tax=Enterococcus durans TaxID=53345 RepID=UPI0039A74F99